ncbi:Cys-tRNA(Pro) deacylase [Mangrovicoccus sp. HB161399]|uniref:Cys-tRNA(Pro) deacylase n=1 Tax=Mangrovicoccus sp. HB161399 TaxID=2720392 RepID=UPI0015548F25|nr:Cys-tRNA(Pro) deacylase [Mangrovicoccus sp. HB161399]
MAKSTPATQALLRAKVAFELASYDYDPGAERVGLQAAEAMGVSPGEVFKTLMVELDGKPACAVLPSDGEVNMKKLAAALGGKSAKMMKPADAERQTGYKVGGVSPLGQKRSVPTVLDDSAAQHGAIYVNGGQRGLQIRIAPADLARVLDCVTAALLR